MIFVTVGTQLPFDRLIGAIDAWASADSRIPVFAQIGPSRLRPRHIEYAQFVSPAECAQRMEDASAIVAHAGMGTILTALELGKPLLVLPRRAALGEHRNEHQLATAHRFAELGKLHVAFDESELPFALDELNRDVVQPRLGAYAPEPLLKSLRAFIRGEPLSQGPEAAPADDDAAFAATSPAVL